MVVSGLDYVQTFFLYLHEYSLISSLTVLTTSSLYSSILISKHDALSRFLKMPFCAVRLKEIFKLQAFSTHLYTNCSWFFVLGTEFVPSSQSYVSEVKFNSFFLLPPSQSTMDVHLWVIISTLCTFLLLKSRADWKNWGRDKKMLVIG